MKMSKIMVWTDWWAAKVKGQGHQIE